MSTSQIIGAFELGIGIATGNPQLMLLGATTMLSPTPPNQYGPRLNDLRVQSSSYGQPIPKLFGTMRIAGNMIWSTALIETAHESSQGGKGSGPTTTNYTYAQSFAVALCEGEIDGILKIWANGKLVYNTASDASVGAVGASSNIPIRVYTGSETQTADSLIEADVGVANAPAYRGVAYVVFENLQLQDYGGRTPNLEFEVVQSGTQSVVWRDLGYTRPTTSSDLVLNKFGQFWAGDTYPNLKLRDGITGEVVGAASLSGIGTTNFAAVYNFWDGSCGVYTNYPPSGYTYKFTIIDHSGTVKTAVGAAFGYFWFNKAIMDADGYVWLQHTNPYSPNQSYLIRSDSGARTPDLTTGLAVSSLSGIYPGRIYYIASQNVRYFDRQGNVHEFYYNATIRFCIPRYDGKVWVGVADTQVVLLSIDGVVEATIDVNPPSHISGFVLASSSYMSVNRLSNDLIGTASDYGASYVFIIASSGDTISYSARILSGTSYAIAQSHSSNGAILGGGATNMFGLPSLPTLVSTPPVLSSIATAICESAGLSAAQIDVTDLTDTVDGYVVQRGTARSWLEQLMLAYQFDAVESDGKIKFVKRGGASVVTIPEDDLAAREYGSALTDALTINRQQEMELPVQVDVSYFDAASAYQTATQYAQRLTTSSSNKASYNLMMALSAGKAKQIADVRMFEAWTSRTTFEQVHGWKYAYLEPTDVITVVNDGVSHVMRIVDEDAAVGVFRRSAVMEDANVYTQDVVAVASPVPSGEVSLVPETRVLLLDIPLLRDQDDGVGFYGAANGYGSGWSGAQLFKSNDDGATWTSFGNAFLNDVTSGIATSALGDYTQNIFDEKSSVTVMMNNGTLSSATELAVLNGANAALLGSEILQFKTATLTAAGTYLLTGLLRGRRGTEWATSTHAIGERFVLLSESDLVLFTGSSAEYDLARKYKGASFGGFLSDAPVVSFTNAAVALIPYAPAQLGGGRNAALDITLKWVRRTRIGGAWNSYSDVPLGEASQAYEVDIYTDSSYATVVRTLTSSTETVSYTAAQQVTDFGSAQATIYFGVFQLSAVVGRGYEQRGTV